MMTDTIPGGEGHTAGPWCLIEDDTDFSISGEGWFEDQHVNGWVIVGNPDDPGMAIAVLDTGYRNDWNDDQLDANARLIAAAPDLLEACKLVAASSMRNAAFDACVAAIARATGSRC